MRARNAACKHCACDTDRLMLDVPAPNRACDVLREHEHPRVRLPRDGPLGIAHRYKDGGFMNQLGRDNIHGNVR
jgi:hypothetical protein